MISCERAWELLSLQLDGALSPQEEQELEEHLESCPACRKERRELAQMNQALRGLGEVQAPADFTQRVMDQVRAESQEMPKVVPLRRRPQVRALVGLAACALICIGIYRVIPQGSNLSSGMVTSSQEPAPAGTPQPEEGADRSVRDAGQQSDPSQPREDPAQAPASVPRTADLPAVQEEESQTQAEPSAPETESDDTQEQPQSKQGQTSYAATASVQTELVVSSLSEQARALLPAQEDWSVDDQGSVSCTVSRPVLEQLCQLLDQEGTEYTVTPEPWSETCTVRVG